MESQESKTVNSKKSRPLFSSSLTVASGVIPPWTGYYRWYLWNSNENEHKIYKHVGRWSREQYCNEQSAENNYRTEEIQHGPPAVPPYIGMTSDMGNNNKNNNNKRMR